MQRLLLGLLFVGAATGSSFAQTSNPLDPVGVVREYIAAQNRHDIDRMLSLLADQVEFRIGLGTASLQGASRNQAQLRAQFTRLAENLPNARTEVLELISEGGVIMTKERTTGLQGGGSDTGLAVYRVRDGKIDTLWVVSSNSGL